VRASYKITDSVNVYATYATGFKASSVNLSRDSRPLVSDIPALRSAGLITPNLTTGTRFAGPENAEVYEIGIKGQFAFAAFNLSLFDQTLKGFQSNIFTGTGFALTNAGSQSTQGIEFDGSVSPIKALTFNVAFTYLDPQYDSFVNTGIFVNGVELDLSGETPSGIPGLATTLGATYTHEFAGGTKLILRTDYSYESQVQIVDNIPGITREVNQLNAAATLAFTNGLEVSVFGRNITDAQYLTTIFPSVAQSGSISGYPSQPVTYGGTVRFKF